MSRLFAAVVLGTLLVTSALRADDAPCAPEPSLAERIETALAAPVDFSIKNVTLVRLAELIGEHCRIPVYLDRRALEEAAIAVDTPFELDCNIEDLPLATVLDIGLQNYDLAYVPQDDVLEITTRTDAELHSETRVYDVTDLIEGDDFNAIVELLSCVISPTTWPDVGGPPPIHAYRLGNRWVLVFPQMVSVHREVEQLLAMLRSFKESKKTMPSPTPLERRVSKALDSPASIVVTGLTVKSLAQKIREACRIPVFVDSKALEEAEITLAQKLVYDGVAEDVRLSTVLKHCLRNVGVVAVPHDGVLWITPPTRAELMQELRVYDVSDLEQDVDIESLENLLISGVHTTSWGIIGGPGVLKPYRLGATTVFVVRQTHQAHCEIIALLAKLRAARDGASVKVELR
jgi:hypothetical protein